MEVKAHARMHDRSSIPFLTGQALHARRIGRGGFMCGCHSGWSGELTRWRADGKVGSRLHLRSSMETSGAAFECRVVRRCLVCDWTEEIWEPEGTDEIGPSCSRCHAPTERISILERHRSRLGVNPHAAALGRLGGLKGGPARAAKLTPQRRRAIAKGAARARWRS